MIVFDPIKAEVSWIPDASSAAAVTSVAGRTGDVVLSNVDISGLGTAATANTGTTNGTIPLLGASGLLATARLGAGTATATEILRGNQTWLTFFDGGGKILASLVPDDLVTSVAGRQGAVVLSNTDISGLGTSATINTGTTSGTIPLLGTGGLLATARLGTGSATATEVLRGDQSWFTLFDGTGKIPTSLLPSSVIGDVQYQGNWNANTNSPAIPAAAAGNKGQYYVVSVAGATSIDGITDWKVGDWLISNGTTWDKIDNTDAVTSVAGRVGAVVLSNTDISGLGTASTYNVGTSGGTIPLLNTANTWSGTQSFNNSITISPSFNSTSYGNFGINPSSTFAIQLTNQNNDFSIILNTVTANHPATITQTWNASGVVFTALKLNVTNTASAAGSRLLDLQVASATKFYVDKAGAIYMADPATTRTNLGGTTVGQNIFTLPDPGAVRFVKINADNTVSAVALDAADITSGRFINARMPLGALFYDAAGNPVLDLTNRLLYANDGGSDYVIASWTNDGVTFGDLAEESGVNINRGYISVYNESNQHAQRLNWEVAEVHDFYIYKAGNHLTGFAAHFDVEAMTASRTYSFPDADGEVGLTTGWNGNAWSITGSTATILVNTGLTAGSNRIGVVNNTAGGTVLYDNGNAYFGKSGSASVTLRADNLTANRQIYWPDAAGTIALTSDLGSYQPLDSDLTAIAALATTSFGRGFLTLADAAATQTYAGLVIGTNVQAYNATLTSWAAITRASGFDTFVATPSIANLKSLITDETTVGWNLLSLADPGAISFLRINADNTVTTQSASAQRTSLGLVIGTDVQAYDAELAAIAGLTSAANKIIRFTGSGSADLLDFDTDATLAAASATRIPSQSAVKNYVDNSVAGLKWKLNVRVASTANVNIASAPSSIDGVTLSTGDRVLLKNQTTGSENGAYIFNGAGSAMTRSTDADTGTELISATFPVSEGTTNQDTWWTVTNDSITLGTTALVISQTSSGGGTYTADEASIHLSGTQFSILSTWAGQTAITTVGTIGTGTWNATAIGATKGGTGQTAVTTGDLLYGSASNTWSRLAGVATGNVLISGGVSTAPSWGKVTSSHVDSTLPTIAGANVFTALQSVSVSNTQAQTNTITGLGTTTLPGLQITNTTAAAAGAQQVSPSVRWTGQGWKTNATAASQSVEFRAYVLPVQGAANPTGLWTLESSVNGGAFGNSVTIDTSGNIVSTGKINKWTLTAPTTAATLVAGADNLTYTFPDITCDIGFRNIPQNSQSANYTLVLADSGKHVHHPSTDANNRTFTIPANSSVAFAVGTAITFTNLSANNLTIAITTDTMNLAGTGTTGSRTLSQYGVATALKVTSTTWIIFGTGLT